MSDSLTNKDELKEKLAAIEHERWADWQKWVHSLMGELEQAGKGSGLMAISKEYFDRWERQIATPYAELSEAEKASDMEQVNRYWHLIENYISDTVAKAEREARIECGWRDCDACGELKQPHQATYDGSGSKAGSEYELHKGA